MCILHDDSASAERCKETTNMGYIPESMQIEGNNENMCKINTRCNRTAYAPEYDT